MTGFLAKGQMNELEWKAIAPRGTSHQSASGQRPRWLSIPDRLQLKYNRPPTAECPHTFREE